MSRSTPGSRPPLPVQRLHAEVDRLAVLVRAAVQRRSRCGLGCTGCCEDDLTVFEVEAEPILRFHAQVLASEPAPAGGCAFLGPEGACRIYQDRPYVCRTQGLPLRWLDEDEDGTVSEYRDICLLNDDASSPLEALPPEACWTLGPAETRLRELQAARDGGELRRVPLRDLFLHRSAR